MRFPWSKKEERATSSKDPYLMEMFGLRDNAAGQIVTPENATGVPAVHACVQVIAETLASLPLPVYRKTDTGGRENDTGHPLNRVLNEQSNPAQSCMEFREQLIASCLLTGNGYALKDIDGRGAIVGLKPLHPDQVRAEKLVNGRVRYVVTPERGGTEIYIQDEILHLKYRSRDGFTGLSPITMARETIGLSVAQQSHEGSLFKNGARPTGVLKSNTNLTDDQITRLKSSWTENFAGPSQAGKVIVLEEGLDYQAISLSQKDADFVESRKLNMEDIARVFRVPPPAIGILDKATYSNITEQSRMLVMHCLRPWMVRIDKAMNMSLLTDQGRRTHQIEHNAEGLLRGSTKDRFEAYRIAREWGWMSVNEIRQKENQNTIGTEGNTYRQPMNSEPLGANPGE